MFWYIINQMVECNAWILPNNCVAVVPALRVIQGIVTTCITAHKSLNWEISCELPYNFFLWCERELHYVDHLFIVLALWTGAASSLNLLVRVFFSRKDSIRSIGNSKYTSLVALFLLGKPARLLWAWKTKLSQISKFWVVSCFLSLVGIIISNGWQLNVLLNVSSQTKNAFVRPLYSRPVA